MPWRLIAGVSFLSIALFANQAPAQSAGGNFSLRKSTVDSGGGTSSGGVYSISGTIAQVDANPQAAESDTFTLAGGFWGVISVLGDLIFKDGFESD